ncbi:MAG: hypothetical protein IJX67_10830 [Oscillospiraceae bacterium]|nr:hypothetical protein [Oscillospiraceae bacterium]
MANANTAPDPWERRQDESTKAYEAFCIYRDMGRERSLSKVSAKLQKSETLMGRWSRTFDWVKRAASWDDEQDRIAREIARKEQAEAIKNMRKRHADVATAMILKAARALNRLKEEDIKPSDISRMMEVASKLERISRGDVGEVVEERDGGTSTPAVTFYMPANGRDQKEEEEE